MGLLTAMADGRNSTRQIFSSMEEAPSMNEAVTLNKTKYNNRRQQRSSVLWHPCIPKGTA
eukprot:scaffold34628_cov166-Amphora_coffeaeformis.AAC.14